MGSIMCYLTWCKVLAETKNFGESYGLGLVFTLRQLSKVSTTFMNDLPQFI